MEEIKNEHLGSESECGDFLPPPPTEHSFYLVTEVSRLMPNGDCSCAPGSKTRDENGVCEKPGKHPVATAFKKNAEGQFGTISAFVAAHPGHNVGVATGFKHPNGKYLYVVDVDANKAKNKTGWATMDALTKQHGPLPQTLLADTPTGGGHCYLWSAKKLKCGTNALGKDVDVLGIGAAHYVNAPPSITADGQYRWHSDPSHPLADMPAWMEELLSLSSAQPKPKRQRASGSRMLDADEIREMLECIPPDDRDTWRNVCTAIKHEWLVVRNLPEEEAYALCDEWAKSSQAGNYDAAENWEQWRTFRTDLPDERQPKLGSVIRLARQHLWQPDEDCAKQLLKSEWCYCHSRKRFMNIADPSIELERENFDIEFAPLFGKQPAAKTIVQMADFVKVKDATYWPGKPRFVEEDGVRKVNTWAAPAVEPEKGDVTPFLEHVAYLLPDERERGILLDYLAFQVQRPGIKVRWAILLQGAHGVGKSYLKHVMKLVLGDRNVYSPENKNFQEKYTGWMRAAQFIVVEELMVPGRSYEERSVMMDQLKPWISEDRCEVRVMWQNAYDMANRFNFLLLTNYEDAIVLPPTERRYCVMFSPAVTDADEDRRDAYFKRLFQWTRENGPALLAYFQSRDLNHFKHNGHAPGTEARSIVVENSRDRIEQFLREAMENDQLPELVTPDDLQQFIGQHGERRPNDGRLSTILKNMGAVLLGRHYLKANKQGPRPRIWALNNGDAWATAESELIVNKYLTDGKRIASRQQQESAF